MGERDERNRTEFGLKRDYRTIKDRPGGAHPRAEQGAVRGSLMLGMVPGMLGRLRLRQSTDHKHAEHDQNCECSFCLNAVHRSSPQPPPRGRTILELRRESQEASNPRPSSVTCGCALCSIWTGIISQEAIVSQIPEPSETWFFINTQWPSFLHGCPWRCSTKSWSDKVIICSRGRVRCLVRRVLRHLVVAMLFCSLTACSAGRQASQSSLPSIAAQERQVCETEVRQAAPVSIQPRWLPPIGGGSATHGVVLGTVDVPHRVWLTREAYQQAIERCLTAHGYETRG